MLLVSRALEMHCKTKRWSIKERNDQDSQFRAIMQGTVVWVQLKMLCGIWPKDFNKFKIY